MLAATTESVHGILHAPRRRVAQRVGILARGPPPGKTQRGRPVRGSTVEGVIGWPAGGDGRGGPVCGTGGGAGNGAVGLVKTPGDDEGNPVRGSIGVWLLGNPVRGSIVDGTPTGGVGVSVGAEGELAPV